MKKRTLSLFLAVLIILPAVVSVGIIFEHKNSFSIFDKQRDDALLNAVGGYTVSENTEENFNDKKFIVQFSLDASFSEIEKALGDNSYSLLAESDARLFAVSAEDSFFEENKDIIDFYEPDLEREAFFAVDDPQIIPAYDSLEIYAAWDKKTASEDIIVAVLDTGVAREHEDLIDVNILAGYDAVSGRSGINGDSAGHGTGVIGLIAATANNAVGIAGVAHGVSILPVKVAVSSNTIYSSDLIRGIRFAADSGAKIINMSVGGYSSSYAEQAAVDYARSKGCILIAAAGNGGTGAYADQKSYPASYEGVVSVASCNASGDRSVFSQYNDMVDIAAYGENIPMPFVDENGNSLYQINSGTSFSCAFVSGIAALAASVVGNDIRFESAEFESLLIDCCSAEKSAELGYGVINARKVVSIAETPIVTGVYNGGKFSESVKIGFNRGTALLDGEDFEDGEAVLTNGSHELVVTDGNIQKKVSFRVNYNPLSYNFLEFVSFAYFEFDRGTALLDGFPYKSGEKIYSAGRHTLILSDGDERLEKQINLRYSLPTVIGVSEGEIYNTPIEIKVVGDGKATLDGENVKKRFVVFENGKHTLSLTSGNGVITEEITFTVQHDIVTNKTDLANATAAVDEKNGYICFYSDSLVGVRINDLYAPEKYLKFIPVGRVFGHSFTEKELVLYTEKGIVYLDRSKVFKGEEAIVKTIDPQRLDYVFATKNSAASIVGRDIFVYNNETMDARFLTTLDFDCELAFCLDRFFIMLSPSTDSIVRVLDTESLIVTQYDLGCSIESSKIVFGEGILAVDNLLFDALSGKKLLEFGSSYAVKIQNGYVYTDLSIIDVESGNVIGSFPYQISDILFEDGANYIFGSDMVMSQIPLGKQGVAEFGAAETENLIFSDLQEMNVYHTNAFFDNSNGFRSVASLENVVYLTVNGENSIFSYDLTSKNEQEYIPLRFKPSDIFAEGGFLIVGFENEPMVYIYDTVEKTGFYVELGGKCRSATVFNGMVYLVCNETLYSLNPETRLVSSIFMTAHSVASDKERLFVVGNNVLAAYDEGLNLLASKNVTNNTVRANGYVTVGTTVYDPETLAEVVSLTSHIIAVKNNTVVTIKGVYSISERDYIGSAETPLVKAAVITDNNTVATFGEGDISLCAYGDGTDVSSIPEIMGVTDGGIYTNSASIGFKKGIGYLDGEQIKSGKTVSDVGVHEFVLVLPCGRSCKSTFTISAKLAEIRFISSERIMSIGEKISLSLIYLPEGARSVPAVFSCDKDGLDISDGGEIIANAIGQYTVTARVDVDGESLYARCVITVRGDLVSVLNTSDLRIDRNNGFVLDVSPATTREEFLENFAQKEKLSVVDKDGNPIDGFVGTGNKIVLKIDGKITDELTVVVRGDADGDGYLSAHDLFVIKGLLKGSNDKSAVYLAADFNHSGDLSDADYREISKILLGKTAYPVGVPEKSPFGYFEGESVSAVEAGQYVDVVVVLHGMKYAGGVYGKIKFSEGLTPVGFDATELESGYYTASDEINFYVFSADGKEFGSANAVVCTLRFLVDKNITAAKIESDGLVVSLKDGVKIVEFKPHEISVQNIAEGEFNIEIGNAENFVFDPDITEYEIIIPYNDTIADIKVTRREGQIVSMSSLAVSDRGKTTITISVSNSDGTVIYYNFSVTKSEAPKVEFDCRLSDLEIEGIKLSPSFSPDFYEYSIVVPHDTEKINIYAVARSDDAKVFIDDTSIVDDISEIEVIVVAPDGESLVYLITVERLLPPIEESNNETDPGSDDDKDHDSYNSAGSDFDVNTEPTDSFYGSRAQGSDDQNGGYVWWILAVLVIASGAVFVMVRSRNKKQ